MGSRDVIIHMTIRLTIGRFLLVVLWKQASFAIKFSAIFSGEYEAMVGVTLTSKRRTRSFIFVPIDSSHTTSYALTIVTFALGRTV